MKKPMRVCETDVRASCLQSDVYSLATHQSAGVTELPSESTTARATSTNSYNTLLCDVTN